MSKSTLLFAAVILGLLAIQTTALFSDKSKVVKLTSSNFKSLVVDSKDVWFVEFYAPWCGHCKNIAPTWEKLAGALEGMIKVGAVDMTTDQDAGSPYNVKGFPTIKFFGADKKNPSDYNGDRSLDDLINTGFKEAKKTAELRAKGKASSGSSKSSKSSSSGSGSGSSGGNAGDKDVVILTDSNFDELVLGSDDLWLVEFYAPWCGHCKKLEPEWNKAATELKGEVKIGKVDCTVHTSLGSRFGVSGYPTIKFFPPGKKTEKSAEDYSAGRDASSITQFALDKKAQHKPVPEVAQLLESGTFDKLCEAQKSICLIAFLPHIYDSSASERNGYIDLLKESAKSNRIHPLNFFWSQGGDQLALEEALNLGSGYPALVAVSLNKKKYGVFKSSFQKKNIDSFINALILGKESLSALNDKPKVVKAKAWDGKDQQPATTEEEL